MLLKFTVGREIVKNGKRANFHYICPTPKNMEFIGYGFALLIGLVLGLTGGGGSILTLPVLVYVMQFNAVTATAYSLFVVGASAAAGTIENFRKGVVEAKAGLWFALPSLAGVFLSRKFVIGAIPDIVYQKGSFTLTKDETLMVGFALIILAVSISMLRKKTESNYPNTKKNIVLTAMRLFAAGILIGLVGAGGGFLFTPLLLYVAHLPMRKAVATSLLIIAINSLLGFTGDIGNIAIDWVFLLLFTAISILGVFIGIYLNRFVNEPQLKRGFGWFALAMALFILAEELVF
jgi:uncharacterized protein